MPILFKQKLNLDNNEVARLSRETGYSHAFCQILLSEGLDTKAKVDKFINPRIDDLYSPFEISGMKEAVERINTAIERQESVVIFGDYDCDGIGAISILLLAMRDKLCKLNFYIPDRNDEGYGINRDSIDYIISQYEPKLLITVDTGITAVSEIEYLKSRGVDVIVTDHHEPQVLPDCILVDPKIEKKGFYDLAGAGVAMKLVEALFGREKAMEYVDIAAISTIADIVPLVSENRIIAYHGLKKLNRNMRRGIKFLFDSQNRLTAYDVAFRIAPRINAAGRVDNANKVVDLFVSNESFILENLAEKLNRDNAERQARCDKITAEALEKLKFERVYEHSTIVLADKNWEVGILGIAAARLAEQFNRPTILFSGKDEIFAGSARSIPTVNLFDSLSALSDYFQSFGGHSQAAGVRLESGKFDDFKRAFDEQVRNTYVSAGIPEVVYDMKLERDMQTLAFIRELELLEPSGCGNPQPKFLMESNGLNFEQLALTQHIKYTRGDFEIIGYNKLSECEALRCHSRLEVSLSRNTFRNIDRVQATIRRTYLGDIAESDAEKLLALNSAYLDASCEGITASPVLLEGFEPQKFVNGSFGTIFVAFSKNTFMSFAEKYSSLIELSGVACAESRNPLNRLILCPQSLTFADYYGTIVFLEKPISEDWVRCVCERTQARAYQINNSDWMLPLRSIDDDFLRCVYIALRNVSVKASPKQRYSLVKSTVEGLTPLAFEIALAIFRELGLVSERAGEMQIVGKKVNLADSKIYQNIKLI